MNSKDILIHKTLASSMEYPELSRMIEELSNEKEELAPHLSLKELEKYDIIIDIYENEQKYLIGLLNTLNHSHLIH